MTISHCRLVGGDSYILIAMFRNIFIIVLIHMPVTKTTVAKCTRNETLNFESTHKILPYGNRISGGIPASLGDVPYQAQVITRGVECGGVIIHFRWILTAAHCVQNVNWKADTRVHYRLTDRSDAYRSYWCRHVSEVIIHEEYTKFHNDIALIKVNRDMRLDKQVKVSAVQISEKKDIYGRDAVFSGWGRELETKEKPRFLQYITMKVLDRKQCVDWWGYLVTERTFCAEAVSAIGNACKGDSGGPLVLKGTMQLIGIGILSAKNSCGVQLPVVFANMSYYKPWVQKHILSDH